MTVMEKLLEKCDMMNIKVREYDGYNTILFGTIAPRPEGGFEMVIAENPDYEAMCEKLGDGRQTPPRHLLKEFIVAHEMGHAKYGYDLSVVPHQQRTAHAAFSFSPERFTTEKLMDDYALELLERLKE